MSGYCSHGCTVDLTPLIILSQTRIQNNERVAVRSPQSCALPHYLMAYLVPSTDGPMTDAHVNDCLLTLELIKCQSDSIPNVVSALTPPYPLRCLRIAALPPPPPPNLCLCLAIVTSALIIIHFDHALNSSHCSPC